MNSPIKVSLVGFRFGKLRVLKANRKKFTKAKSYECKCDCGRKVTVQGHDLRSGNVLSCGGCKAPGRMGNVGTRTAIAVSTPNRSGIGSRR